MEPEPEPGDSVIEDSSLPISGERLREFLIQSFSSNYRDKFGIPHVVAKNVFSVSSLVSGPRTTLSNMQRNMAEADPVTGDELRVFNMPMFRGSAIHDYAIKKLPKFYAYEKISVREEFAHEWRDPELKTIIMQGHPDFVHYGKLEIGDVVFCEDGGIVLELKTVSPKGSDPKKLASYKKHVLMKAKRQVGCYARMLSNEVGRPHYPYVVVFDESTVEGLSVYPLSTSEIWAGYNYCKWSARECARLIEEDSNTPPPPFIGEQK